MIALPLNDQIRRSCEGFPGLDEADHILTYGYYDPDKGVSLELLCCGRRDEKGFQFYNGYDKKNVHIRISAVDDEELFYIQDPDGSLKRRFKKKIRNLNKFKPSEEIEKTRNMTFLDPSRDKVFIDRVNVILSKKGLPEETVKTGITDVADHYFLGVLLDEPVNDFGFHVGEQIAFYIKEDPEKGVVCFTDLTPNKDYTEKDLEDGSLLKEAVISFNENRTEEKLLDLLQYLRDSRVFIACNAIPDPKNKDHPDYLVPEIMESEGKRFFPVFSSLNEMKDYETIFSVVRRDFPDVLQQAESEKPEVSGIVLDPFTLPFVLSRDLFGTVKGLKSRKINPSDVTPDVQARD